MFASKPLNDVMREISVQVGGSMYPSMNPDKQALAAKYIIEETCRVANLPESTLSELLDHFGVYEDDDASGTV